MPLPPVGATGQRIRLAASLILTARCAAPPAGTPRRRAQMERTHRPSRSYCYFGRQRTLCYNHHIRSNASLLSKPRTDGDIRPAQVRRHCPIPCVFQWLVHLLVVLRMPALAVLIWTNQELFEFRRLHLGAESAPGASLSHLSIQCPLILAHLEPKFHQPPNDDPARYLLTCQLLCDRIDWTEASDAGPTGHPFSRPSTRHPTRKPDPPSQLSALQIVLSARSF